MKKVLLDENLDRRLKIYFSDKLEVIAVPDLGWQSMKNGELLAAMTEAKFDYLLTADKSLRFQQNLAAFEVKVIVLLVYDTRLKFLRPYVGEIEQRIFEFDESQNFLEIDLRNRIFGEGKG